MALMFPIVMLVVNCSSVAVIWFGAPRIQDGSLTIGAMVAFLSYFTIILMSIMMASFVMMMAPRAAVSAERIVEILDTDTSVNIADEPTTEVVGQRHPRAARRELRLPRRRGPGARGHLVHLPPRPDDRHHRQHRLGQDHPRQPHPPAGRRHRRRGDGRRRRRPRARPRGRCGAGSAWCPRSRTSSPARWRATSATAARTPPTRRCGRRSRWPRPPTSSGRWAASRPASPRAAPTSPAASASGSPSPGRSCAGPRSTCSTTPSRPSTWPPTPASGRRSCPGPARPPSWWWPSGSPPSSTPTRSSSSRTARWSGSAPTPSCSRRCPTYAEIVASQTKQQEAAA